jgi:hypothetical protein
VKDKAPVVKQLYKLSVEPRVVDELAKLATRTGESKSRLATRLFTDAVMAAKAAARRASRRLKVRNNIGGALLGGSGRWHTYRRHLDGFSAMALKNV